MYPEITPLIRDAIKRRYELIPYLYSLMLESHMSATPPQRWTGWGYESDPEVWTPAVMAGETQYWLGDTLLVGGVYEPGVTTAKMYLPGIPGNEGYINLNAPYQYFDSCQWVEIESPWKKSIPLLAKVGGGVVIGRETQTRSGGDFRYPSPNVVEDDYRAVEIFPPGEASDTWYSYTWYEDNGISQNADVSSFTLKYRSANESRILVEFVRGAENNFKPRWKGLDIILPRRDSRIVSLVDGTFYKSTYKSGESHGRPLFTVILHGFSV